MVTPDGNTLQGWMATNGTVNTNGPIGDLKIPFGQTLSPVATTNGAVTGNLAAESSSSTPVGNPVQTQVTMYDPLGNPHQISYVFTPTGTPDQWDVSVNAGGTALATTPATVTVNFDPTAGATAGQIIPATDQTFTIDPSGVFPSWTGAVTADLSGLTQFGGGKTTARSRRAGERRRVRGGHPASRSPSATTARSPASTPTACDRPSVSWPWRPSPTRAA